MRPRYFVLRLTRYGPLLPARLWWCDHGPEDPPDNKLDRGRLNLYPRADIAGSEVPPEELAERLVSMTDPRPAHPPSHWKYARPCGLEEYRLRFDALRRAEKRRPDDPVLRTRRPLAADDLEVPNFNRERELLL
jgi:hypothetical protein